MPSNSSPSEPARAVSSGSRTAAGNRVKLPWFWLLLASGIVLGIYVAVRVPREIGLWYLAAATENWTDAESARVRGDSAGAAESQKRALALVDEALSWSPGEPYWILARAQMKRDSGRFEEALDDCNLVKEQMGAGRTMLTIRSQIYQHLGKHAEAVADMERVNAISKTSGYPTRAEALNNLSYVKAVGKVDLPQALKDADASVREAAAKVAQFEEDDKHEAELNWAWQYLREVTKEKRMAEERAANMDLAMRLDTRGFIHYQMGEFQKALDDLQPAGARLDEFVASPAKVALMQKRTPDIREVDSAVFGQRQATAVVIYHRSLAHEKLGHAAAAEVDRKRVRELIGRDGDESLF